MTRTVARPSDSATTARNASVNRPWKVLGNPSRPRGAGRLRPSSSALGEGVTDTTHRQDEGRRRRIVLDLVAQVGHMHVDGLLILVEGLVVAQQLEQLGPGVDAPRSRGEVAQDLELCRGQAHAPRAALDAPTLEVDQEVAVADHAATDRIRQVAV